MGKEQLELLRRDGRYLSVPKGISMRPMIRGGQDAVLIEKIAAPPKRYDLVMYVRPGLQGVIHRIISVQKDKYIICGDNCWQLEHVKKEQVKGIVTRFNRKGKWYSVEDKRYLIYVHIWTDLLFLRRSLFYVRDRCKHLWKRLARPK